MRTEYLYRQVERKVQGLIEGGVLVDGERVPSLRQMSRQAGVSLATVTQAYLELERKGLLEARPKSGFFVRERPGPEIDVPASAKPHMSPRRVQFGRSVQDRVHSSARPHRAELRHRAAVPRPAT